VTTSQILDEMQLVEIHAFGWARWKISCPVLDSFGQDLIQQVRVCISGTPYVVRVLHDDRTGILYRDGRNAPATLQEFPDVETALFALRMGWIS